MMIRLNNQIIQILLFQTKHIVAKKITKANLQIAQNLKQKIKTNQDQKRKDIWTTSNTSKFRVINIISKKRETV